MQSYNPNQYYDDYTPAMEKTSRTAVTVNWSDVRDTIIGIVIMVMLVISAGIY